MHSDAGHAPRDWGTGSCSRGPLSASVRADLAAITDLGFHLVRAVGTEMSPPLPGSMYYVMAWRRSSPIILDSMISLLHVVRKVRLDAGGLDRLIRSPSIWPATRMPAPSSVHSASEYVRTHHDWSVVAERYVEIVERCHAERTIGGMSGLDACLFATMQPVLTAQGVPL